MVRIVGGILAFLLVASAAGIVSQRVMTDEQVVSAKGKKGKVSFWKATLVVCTKPDPVSWGCVAIDGGKKFPINRCARTSPLTTDTNAIMFMCW